MDKENERNEVALVLEVDAEVIEKVRTGEITKIGLDITEDNYRQILQNTDGHLLLVVEEMPNTFHSCYLYNKGEFPYAIKDELSFLVLSSGDDKAGIVFSGQFISDPYPADDWGGSTRRRMYVDMVCFNPSDPAAGPHISLEQLQAAIPSVDWATGHSGILLSEEIAEKLTEL